MMTGCVWSGVCFVKRCWSCGGDELMALREKKADVVVGGGCEGVECRWQMSGEDELRCRLD